MAHDGKLLARARDMLSEEKQKNLAEQQRRIELIYHQIPEIEIIDSTMRAQMAELVRLTLSKPQDLKERIHSLQERNLDLQMRRAELLTARGYPIDFLDEIICCPKCHDTGYVDGSLCSCMERRYNQVMTRELSGLLRDDTASFETFNLSYYSDIPDPASGISPNRNQYGLDSIGTPVSTTTSFLFVNVTVFPASFTTNVTVRGAVDVSVPCVTSSDVV